MPCHERYHRSQCSSLLKMLGPVYLKLLSKAQQMPSWHAKGPHLELAPPTTLWNLLWPLTESCLLAGQCSQYGMCFSGLLTTPNAAPTIALVMTAAASQTTSIKLGYDYRACASGQQPHTGAECELGATASDSQNGNLTSQVLVCAPAGCTTAACVASECILMISSAVSIC